MTHSESENKLTTDFRQIKEKKSCKVLMTTKYKNQSQCTEKQKLYIQV